jgi:TPR repeat protein
MTHEDIDKLKARAIAGDTDAQVRLGNRYLEGFTAEKDIEEAKKWYLLAGESGTADGFMALGLYYCDAATPPDYSKALEAYEKAADLGHVGAQLNAGRIYWMGQGVEQSYLRAGKWIKLAADAGHEQGLFLLGGMYAESLGVKQDYKLALKYYQQSADLGYVCAMFNLGNMYREGQGVKKNMSKATELYRAGSVHNHPPSLCNLGVSYMTGIGVEQDPKEGMRLFYEAAIRGYTVAQMNMAGNTAFGQGCRKNIPLAYAWATIASAVSRTARDFLQNELGEITHAQKKRGEKLIIKLNKLIAEAEPSPFPFVNDGIL